MCNCINITPQSKECYAQMITLPIPPHMQSYREAREEAGLTPLISIDPCIVDEIQELWSKGIVTYGSCCGHNLFNSMVNVREDQSGLMLEMGYVMDHPDPARVDTFKLKSV